MNAEMKETVSHLQQRFSNDVSATLLSKLAVFVQEQFSKNKASSMTMFEAIHRTNIACTRELERIATVKFATSFGKFISQAIISATGVNVIQAYQDARDAKANRVINALKQNHSWEIIEGAPTFSADGKTFKLTWDETKSVAHLEMDQKVVYTLAVAGYGHDSVASLIDSAIFDEL